jgi:hypothetical protein
MSWLPKQVLFLHRISTIAFVELLLAGSVPGQTVPASPGHPRAGLLPAIELDWAGGLLASKLLARSTRPTGRDNSRSPPERSFRKVLRRFGTARPQIESSILSLTRVTLSEPSSELSPVAGSSYRGESLDK